jgi:hypothetical protein
MKLSFELSKDEHTKDYAKTIVLVQLHESLWFFFNIIISQNFSSLDVILMI